LLILEDHSGQVSDVIFFPDNRQLASASRDDTVIMRNSTIVVFKLSGKPDTRTQFSQNADAANVYHQAFFWRLSPVDRLY